MKITKAQSARQERKVLAAMIRNRQLLSVISNSWPKQGLFGPNEQVFNEIGSLCVKFYRKHGKAPRGDFEELLVERYSNAPKEKTDQVDLLLNDIAQQNGQQSTDHLINLAEQVFNKAAYRRYREQIEEADLRNALGKEDLEPFKPIKLLQNLGSDFFTDDKLFDDLFGEQRKPLFTFEGDLGIIVGDVFVKRDLISFIAREKGGKSWWLGETIWQTLLNGHRAVYFTVGDMSEAEIAERIAIRAAACPAKREGRELPYKTKLPIEFEGESLRGKAKAYKKFLSKRMALEARDRWFSELSNTASLKIVERPSYQCTVEDIAVILGQWQDRQSWRPDLVVIDYADILASPVVSQRDEFRHRIDATWACLRALAQKFDCCVVTATQAGRAKRGSEYELLTPTNISEDKRKLAHVAAMFGIVRIKGGGEYDAIKLNCLAKRKGRFDVERAVKVAGCLDLARPFVISSLE